MRTLYRPLVGLAFRHGFFVDGVARPLSLAPTCDSALLMRSHRCRLHDQLGGGTVHVGIDEAGLLAASLDAATPLAFAATCDDPYFPGYTATDWTPGFVVHYCNRPEPPVDPANPGERLLTGETVALKSRRFRHAFASAQRGTTIDLRRLSDGATAFSAPAPRGDFTTLALDLRGLAEGRYELLIDGVGALAFYLCDSDPQGLFAIVELFGLGAIAAGAPPAVMPLYVVSLQARATIWRYLILGAASADIAIAGLLDKKQPIAFTGPTPASLGAEPAVAFQSKDPIPLLERPASRYAMSLTIRGGAGGDATRPLPFAGRETGFGSGVSEMVARV